MRKSCLLCERELEQHPDFPELRLHPDVEDCLVRLTDQWGVAVEHEPDAPMPLDQEALVDGDEAFDFSIFKRVDDAFIEIFDSYGLPRLGGASSGRGWSSISTFQKCPYAWKRRYVDEAEPFLSVESEGRAIGSIVHTHLALHYAAMIEDSPYKHIIPEAVHERLMRVSNPKFVQEGWRLFQAYRLFYQYEEIQPLAIEYNLRDPRTFESCRYDLIAYIPTALEFRPPGTYVIEHKTAQRFDRATLDGWPNDGEVIGQVALWERLGMKRRFGELQGVIVNIIGKQKDAQMHRTIVSPSAWQIDQHLKDLKRWEGLLNLAQKYDEFPRARNSCVGRYGMCEWFDHCASGE